MRRSSEDLQRNTRISFLTRKRSVAFFFLSFFLSFLNDMYNNVHKLKARSHKRPVVAIKR